MRFFWGVRALARSHVVRAALDRPYSQSGPQRVFGEGPPLDPVFCFAVALPSHPHPVCACPTRDGTVTGPSKRHALSGACPGGSPSLVGGGGARGKSLMQTLRSNEI